MDYEEYFEKLYNDTHDKVLIYIISKCGKTEDIEDIFQETYMEIAGIIRKKGTAYIRNCEAFVIQIARRKIHRHYTLLERFKAYRGEEYDANELADPISLEDYVLNREMVEQVQIFLKSKSEIVKKVFYLYYGMDLSISEIARALSLTESNVKNHLYRTLKEIREHLIE